MPLLQPEALQFELGAMDKTLGRLLVWKPTCRTTALPLAMRRSKDVLFAVQA
jgi:hypothetical protein